MCYIQWTQFDSDYIPVSGNNRGKKCRDASFHRYFEVENNDPIKLCTSISCKVSLEEYKRETLHARTMCEACWAEIMLGRIMDPFLDQLEDWAKAREIRSLMSMAISRQVDEGPCTERITFPDLIAVGAHVLPMALEALKALGPLPLERLDRGYRERTPEAQVEHLLRNEYKIHRIEETGINLD